MKEKYHLRILAGALLLRLGAKAHLAASPFFSFIQRLSQQTKLAGLTHQEEAPLGSNGGAIPPPKSELSNVA